MEESASASQPHCIANEWRLERIEFTRQQSHHPAEEQNTLPLTTSISNLLLRLLTRHQHPEPGIAYKLARYISLLIIRELATLEDLFIKSPFYPFLRYLTPSILPKSSTYPFLLTLIVGGIQLRKLWKHQQQLLINLSLSLAPLINTLRVLTHIQIQQDRIQTQYQAEDSNHYQELRRWTMYWLIYCSLINLESLKLPTFHHTHLSPILTRPTIYPNTATAQTHKKHHDRSYKSVKKALHHLTQNVKAPTLQHLLNLLPTLTIRPSSAPSKLPRRITPPRLPIDSLDLHLLPAVPPGQVQVPLPEYLFGQNRWLYGLLKLGFLRWCASPHSRGSEVIWARVFAPVVSVIGRSGASTYDQPKNVKVVHVTISSDKNEDAVNGVPAISEPLHPPRSGSSKAPLDRISRQAHPATHYPQEDSPESPTSWSVRRIKSDPTPARWAPLGRPGNALADPTDRENRAEDPDVASLSPCPSPYPPSLIESSLVSKTSPFQRHKRASSLAKQHHALDFKTPDNAWDSLSFVG
ncbi:hypothetical protein PCASD_20537 [Puccinia coronata f. sp. avenae]|uniref:Uncharacterized protein n=1 Tax=Puccinia coronata f. sp. avenae TaxID=200324 RepID=A0A2N5T0Z2_9BASI|nr:hypothetical protein PCASD_20537 [Puccinia coronata f. sp. avenae]